MQAISRVGPLALSVRLPQFTIRHEENFADLDVGNCNDFPNNQSGISSGNVEYIIS